MPAQPFSPQAVQHVRSESPPRQAVLDDNVGNSVEIGVGKRYRHPAVIRGDQVKPLGFIERKPRRRIRDRGRIVSHHTPSFVSIIAPL